MNILQQVLLAAAYSTVAYDATYGEDIINGKKAKKDAQKYMASVQINGKHKCGGFLISESYVLTAAQCDGSGRMSVILGTHSISGNNLKRCEVEKKHKLMSFKNEKTGDDIMLLKFSGCKVSKKSKYVKIIKIQRKDKAVKPRTKCLVAGWGKTEKQNTVNDLMVADVSIISLKDCQKQWKNMELPANVLCTGGKESKRGACQGDSGGPLVCGGVAVGIFSLNNQGCDDRDKTSVYTQISKYTNWIDKIINKVP
ncbi:granzyme B-like isoform X2 [Hoplias malabaricus]|uniref:granzyme B-like isoform X2 n=1 Tax=Hoplias malabaricus TaxID=27720 RepID=UPI003461E6C8